MKVNEMTDHDLDRLLDAARGGGPAPSDALMARVMADAVAAQSRKVVRPALRIRQGYRSLQLLDRLAAAFGGAGALAGVCSAMVAGIFIGIAQPAPVAALTSVLLTGTQVGTVDLFPTGVAFWEEQQND